MRAGARAPTTFRDERQMWRRWGASAAEGCGRLEIGRPLAADPSSHGFLTYLIAADE